ncbi:hypothetical protein ATPR_3537 [Acetobacter tropicalis NBRC 101654]|uniref:Uncharacterized protein n=1 Tax=Acetobacter tropicalis NBRC 101654 TaxID=749388 RepID=F7VJI8_9PROT|nr:hypothetical protein ATPR_3537 [Acetobacter tropicalis NBRC 101654]
MPPQTPQKIIPENRDFGRRMPFIRFAADVRTAVMTLTYCAAIFA